MGEKPKNKDADTAKKEDDLEEGLEGSFPGSDPASATEPSHEGDKAEEKKK